MSLVAIFVLVVVALILYARRLPGPVDIRELMFRSHTVAAEPKFIQTSADSPSPSRDTPEKGGD